MRRLRHYPGPGAHLDCLLEDAIHGVCLFHWRVDTLTTAYSPRINIRPFPFFSEMSILRTNNPFTGSRPRGTVMSVHVLLVLEDKEYSPRILSLPSSDWRPLRHIAASSTLPPSRRGRHLSPLTRTLGRIPLEATLGTDRPPRSA